MVIRINMTIMDYRRNMMDFGFPGGCQDFVFVRNTDELSLPYIFFIKL